MMLWGKHVLFMTTAAEIGGGSKILFAVAGALMKDNRCSLIVQEDCPVGRTFRSMGGDVWCVKMPAWRKFRSFFTRWQGVDAIEKIIRDQKVDLVCCNSYRINPYAWHVSRRGKVPFLTYVHDRLEPAHVGNFMLDRTQAIIAPSFYVKEYLQGIDHVRVIHNGIEREPCLCQPVDLKAQLGLAREDFLIGMVAHFTPNKRHAALIDAAALLGAARVHVVFIGGDIYSSSVSQKTLEVYAASKGCSERVHFLGQRMDVSALLMNFDLFAFPCRHEAFGLSALEAMRAGVPVLADVGSGGTLEIVQHGENGEVVDFSDPVFVAERIAALKVDPGLLRRYGACARERFLERFTADRFLDETLGFYAEVVERGKK